MKNFVFAILLLALVSGCKKHPTDGVTVSDGMRDTCAVRLNYISRAKQHWADKYNMSTNDTPTEADLEPFMRGFSPCPSGGTYTIGKVGELPTCSVPEHQAFFAQKVKDEEKQQPPQ